MSRRSNSSAELESFGTSRVQRWLVVPAGAMVATAAIAGAGLVTAPSAGAAAAVGQVQDVALTSASGGSLVGLLDEVQKLLTFFPAIGHETLGTLLPGLSEFDSVTLDHVLGGLLGDFGDKTLNSLLGPLGFTVGGLLNTIFPQNIDSMLTSVGLSGTGEIGTELAKLPHWLGITTDSLNTWFHTDLSASDTLNQALGSLFGGATVGDDTTLGGLLGGIDLGGHFGTLGDFGLLSLFGIDGSQTVSETISGLFGSAGGEPLLGLLGSELLGVDDLGTSTTLSELVHDIIAGLGSSA